jgi:hypothetical protein
MVFVSAHRVLVSSQLFLLSRKSNFVLATSPDPANSYFVPCLVRRDGLGGRLP